MLYETTSRDVKTKFSPFQDIFASSSREEISIRGTPEKPFFAVPDLLQIVQIYYCLSSGYQFFESRSETVRTDNYSKNEKIKKLLKDISNMVDEIIAREKQFQDIDKEELLNSISKIFNNFTSSQLEISREELFKRIENLVVLRAAFGILNELSPEDIEDFDELVKRRPLFGDLYT
jgi:hypothetical protein